MDGHDFILAGARLTARPSGALWWAEARVLCVSDLHLGKARRPALHGGALLPPYDSLETLARLAAEAEALSPAHVVCLGDSFDDPAAADEIDPDAGAALMRLMAGRRWTWIAGNHDPGPLGIGGAHRAELVEGPLTFRHEAAPGIGAAGEVSGHFHPKARLRAGGRGLSRPCFLTDGRRLVMPAFGAYAGGLDLGAPALAALIPDGLALLTGARVVAAPISALRGRRGACARRPGAASSGA